MATYTHFEATPPLTVGIGGVIAPATWIAAIGSSYSANSSKITITNSDGTLTLAYGSFTISNGTVVGGTIASLERTSSNGATVYEKITGTSISAPQFVAASPADKLGLALTGADNLFGYSGDDLLNGYGDLDHMTGGAGNDTYFVDTGLDVVTELANQGHDQVNTNVARNAPVPTSRIWCSPARDLISASATNWTTRCGATRGKTSSTDWTAMTVLGDRAEAILSSAARVTIRF